MYRQANEGKQLTTNGDGTSLHEMLAEKKKKKKEAKKRKRSALNEDLAKSTFQNPMAQPDSDDSEEEATD